MAEINSESARQMLFTAVIFHNLGRWKVFTDYDVFYYRLGFSTGQLLYRVSALVFALHNTGNKFVMHARRGEPCQRIKRGRRWGDLESEATHFKPH